MDFQLDGFHRLRAVSKDEANCTETFLAIDERRNEEVLIKVVDLDEECASLSPCQICLLSEEINSTESVGKSESV